MQKWLRGVILASLWLQNAAAALSQADVETMLANARNTLQQANSATSVNQKQKLLQQAQAITTVLDTYGKHVNLQHQSWTQGTQSNVSAILATRAAATSDLFKQIRQLDQSVSAQLAAIAASEAQDQAVAQNTRQLASLNRQAQVNARKNGFAVAANIAANQRNVNLSNLQAKIAAEDDAAQLARDNWAASALPSGSSRVPTASSSPVQAVVDSPTQITSQQAQLNARNNRFAAAANLAAYQRNANLSNLKAKIAMEDNAAQQDRDNWAASELPNVARSTTTPAAQNISTVAAPTASSVVNDQKVIDPAVQQMWQRGHSAIRRSLQNGHNQFQANLNQWAAQEV